MRLSSCHCCGLAQQLPPVPVGQRPVCVRCGASLRHINRRRNDWTRALALAALWLYPPALLLPMLHIERLGHSHENSLLSGVVALWRDGHWLIGAVILLFSVLLPLAKLVALWLLAGPALQAQRRAGLYHLVEFVGRWGMLDVLLVAVLVAFVKLGDLVTIAPGPGLFAFMIMVLLSLLAGLVFNPLLMWEDPE